MWKGQTSRAPGSSAPPVVDATAIPRRLPRVKIPEVGALTLVLIGISLYFAVTTQYFFTVDNFIVIGTNAAILGILACPGTLLIIAGQFDLSVGSGVAFVSVVMAVSAESHSIFLSVILAIGGALLIAVVNGFSVTVLRVNPLITTLATLSIFRGLAQVIAQGQTIPLTGLEGLGTGHPFSGTGMPVLEKIPLPVLLFAGVAVVFWVLMRYTVYGRAMYAIGANPTAARLAGIPTRRLIFIAFLLSGACVALSGLIDVSQLGAASPVAASGLELQVVTAVILGGASLAGGRGTLVGSVLAVFIIETLNNGLIQLQVDAYWQAVAQGGLLLVAVAFDQLRIRLTRVA
jgi:ribose transport system permease protein